MMLPDRTRRQREKFPEILNFVPFVPVPGFHSAHLAHSAHSAHGAIWPHLQIMRSANLLGCHTGVAESLSGIVIAIVVGFAKADHGHDNAPDHVKIPAGGLAAGTAH